MSTNEKLPPANGRYAIDSTVGVGAAGQETIKRIRRRQADPSGAEADQIPEAIVDIVRVNEMLEERICT